jgi:hypothetical protein
LFAHVDDLLRLVDTCLLDLVQAIRAGVIEDIGDLLTDNACGKREVLRFIGKIWRRQLGPVRPRPGRGVGHRRRGASKGMGERDKRMG